MAFQIVNDIYDGTELLWTVAVSSTENGFFKKPRRVVFLNFAEFFEVFANLAEIFKKNVVF